MPKKYRTTSRLDIDQPNPWCRFRDPIHHDVADFHILERDGVLKKDVQDVAKLMRDGQTLGAVAVIQTQYVMQTRPRMWRDQHRLIRDPTDPGRLDNGHTQTLEASNRSPLATNRMMAKHPHQPEPRPAATHPFDHPDLLAIAYTPDLAAVVMFKAFFPGKFEQTHRLLSGYVEPLNHGHSLTRSMPQPGLLRLQA